MSKNTEVAETLSPDQIKLIERLVGDKLDERIAGIEEKVERALSGSLSDRATIVVFSGDMDRLMAAFIIATGAAAMGTEVSMFFTFWGLTAVRKEKIFKGKSIPEKMIACMLPSGPGSVGTSKMNMAGIGPRFFKHLMGKQNVQSLPELIDVARELEVKMIGCQMSMDVMGIRREELLDDLEFGGVATYLGDACDSRLTLFI